MHGKSNFVSLTHQEMEAMVLTAEGSQKIYKRFQYFLWSQSSLHRFVQHEALVCAWGDVAANRYRYFVFSQNEEHEAAVRDLLRSSEGFMARFIAEWRQHGAAPYLLGAAVADHPFRDVADQLARFGFSGDALAHGTKEIVGDGGSFFIFLNLSDTAGSAMDMYMLELLMPYMHMALLRVIATENDSIADQGFRSEALSSRELEVLHLVRDGKTNLEIAQFLEISTYTVKNHMKKILCKLNATNRTQAVTNGINSNVL
jgi:transcriptional regulator EpsA